MARCIRRWVERRRGNRRGSRATSAAVRIFQLAVVILQLHGLPGAEAQAPQQRLLDRTPFDQITLAQEAEGKTLAVLPLDLPQRPLAVKPAAGSLRVRLLDRPTQEFEVSWDKIAQVRVFEQLLLDEARRLTAAGQFDEAYDYFSRLSADFPSLPGLAESISDYLRRNALALYQANQDDRALALLLTLYRRDPKLPGLETATDKVASEIIERYLRDGDYAAARSVLTLWQSQFKGLEASAAAGWQRRFEAAATRHASEAARLTEEQEFIAARAAAGKAFAIWPQLEAATTVMTRIQREFPFVTVGVFETAPRQTRQRIDSWPAIRAGRLTERLLVEQVGFGAEGGIYQSPFGTLSLDESGRQLSLELNTAAIAGSLTADSLARYFLSMAGPASPHVRTDFAALVSGVTIGPPNTVHVHFSRIHVRPEPYLQVSGPSSNAGADFKVADYAPPQVLFAARAPTSHQPQSLQAIVEQTISDDEAAVASLLAGDIDVLDRVPPWHLPRLRAAHGIRVDSYRLPTVHVLIPNLRRPLLAKREFRRALCFGIDRQWIVERVVLGGEKLAGFEVVSGPFPAGISLSDPIRYGYNNQLSPRPFEPRLAAILAAVAWTNVQTAANAKEEKSSVEAAAADDIPELTLAHSTDPVARLACQSIQAQLQRQGIPLKLKECTADELAADNLDCDLRYAELAAWEPVTDARRLLGPGSLTGDLHSPYLDAALRRLDEATNWNDVRARLAELHEIAHHELPVIPLWQSVNYFAYRTSVRGIGESPLTLYQNSATWSPTAAANMAQINVSAP